VALTHVAGSRVKGAANSRWVDRLARIGLVAKGVLYLTVAALAAGVGFGGGGQSADQQGALRAIAGRPFGFALLVALAVGLAAYAAWRLAQAVVGPDEDGTKGVVLRISFVVRAFVYGALCATTVRLVAGGGASGGGDATEQSATARLLDLPFGVALVVAVGVIVIGVGLYQGYTGLSHSFSEDFSSGDMKPGTRRWAERIGVAGHLSRMVVLGLVGLFLVRAGLTHDPQQAVGLDGALQEVASAPLGTGLLMLVALGLACYGVYCFVLARWGRTREID
jgi:hypothetical protein